MSPSKNEQRKKLKIKLTSLNAKDRDLKSIKINSNLNRLLSKYKIDTLCIFMPTAKEPNLNINELLKQTSSIYCPKFTNKNYAYSKIKSTTELKLEKYNILEPSIYNPISNKKLKSNDTIFLVPLVGFDKFGNRIGYGNGYYDQLLENVTGIKIGICFSFQEISEIKKDPHDISLNYIITENEIVTATQPSPKD